MEHQDATSDDEPEPGPPSQRQYASSSRPHADGSQADDSQADGGRQTASERQAPSGQGAATDAYCTHACLLGLLDGVMLDESCPNAALHGKNRHRLTQVDFRESLKQQLNRNLDVGCHTFGRHGSRGVFFKITLVEYGYTVAAKGSPVYFSQFLQHEAAIYEHLRPIQGKYVSVCLGTIELSKVYRYQGTAQIQHFLLLSFAGKPIADGLMKSVGVRGALKAVRDQGIAHGDRASRNVMHDEESGRSMVIDFERAKFAKPAQAPGMLSEQSANNVQGDEMPMPCK